MNRFLTLLTVFTLPLNLLSANGSFTNNTYCNQYDDGFCPDEYSSSSYADDLAQCCSPETSSCSNSQPLDCLVPCQKCDKCFPAKVCTLTFVVCIAIVTAAAAAVLGFSNGAATSTAAA